MRSSVLIGILMVMMVGSAGTISAQGELDLSRLSPFCRSLLDAYTGAAIANDVAEARVGYRVVKQNCPGVMELVETGRTTGLSQQQFPSRQMGTQLQNTFGACSQTSDSCASVADGLAAEASTTAAIAMNARAIGLGVALSNMTRNRGKEATPSLPGHSTASTQGCNPRLNRLQAQARQLSANVRSLGICQMARQSAPLYRELAGLHRQCYADGAAAAQASEYDRAAAQADRTAAAACLQR